MSELSELSRTNDIVTVDNYRYFVTCGNEDFEDTERFPFLMGLYKLFAGLSLSVRFSLARDLLNEIGMYKNSFNRDLLNIDQRIVLIGLLNSFKHYESIEHEEFARLLEIAPPYIIDRLINNRSLPLDFLLDSSLLEQHKYHPMFQDLQKEVRYVKTKRKPEIIAYCRNKITGSEHMSDEMVLSVAGVNLGVTA